jgi:hypothetical protein
MMKALQLKLESSPVFRSWIALHKGAFLFLVFAMYEPGGSPDFEFSYYLKKENETTSFGVEPSAALKQTDVTLSGNVPETLNIEKAKVDSSEAVRIAKEVLETKYSAQTPIKIILMLQAQANKPMWNVTFFTASFSTLNIRVDAVSGKVIEHSIKKLFDFAK